MNNQLLRKKLKCISITSLIALGIILTVSCKKDKSVLPDVEIIDTQTTQDESMAESTFDDVVQMAKEAIDSTMQQAISPTSLSIGSCATVSIDTTNTLITIDFGTSGCVGADNRTRTGKIIVDYLGNYREPNSSITITFDDFTTNGNRVSGKVSYFTLSRNANGNLSFVTNIKDGELELADGTTIKYNTTRTFVWLNGEQSGDPFDDVFQIIGDSDGSNSNGISFTMHITEPITFKASCWEQFIFYPVSGVKQITPGNLGTRTVNFGDGSCDKEVTITFEHIDYTVTLP
ncbi:MAG: hypothetical protein K9G61_02705 [Bacteroidales bacterium]|nr:hypothetical protein [Bacteroidales bacterium]